MKFIWHNTHDEAFETLKKKLTEKPILTFPDIKKKFVLLTDASSHAVAGVLNQEDEQGHLLPIEYFSRLLKGSESRYGATELEALAIIASIKKFHIFLYNKEFTVKTDHKGLVNILTSKNALSPRVFRWSLLLQEYKFEVQYVPVSYTHLTLPTTSRV